MGKWRPDINDLIFLVGAIILGTAAYSIGWVAMLIYMGFFLVVVGLLGALRP